MGMFACVGVHARMHAYVWKSEDNFGCFSADGVLFGLLRHNFAGLKLTK